MALLAVVVLGVPGIASAGQPTVHAPTGPESGGVFTGPYTFDTYINCSGGASFNSSYTNSLDGTHAFAFYGAADGSLLVTIDGGGLLLITSCGNPLTGPMTNVADYTVTKGNPPSPTPTPSATPSPTPRPSATPTPPAGSGSSKGSGSNGGGNAAAASGGTADTPTPQTNPGQPTPVATTPTAAGTPVPTGAHNKTPAVQLPFRVSGQPEGKQFPLTLAMILLGLALLGILIVVLSRSRHARERLHSAIMPLKLRFEPHWLRFRHAVRTHLPTPHGLNEPKKKGLSAHHHSGRLLAHHHTSYPALAFLLLVSAILAAAASYATQADSSDSSVVSLTVNGPPPSTAPTIDDPTTGDHVSTNSITVRGTCQSGLLVEVDRNTDFAGDTMCDASGLYSVLITLVPNENDLVARHADALGQYGPDSNVVIVFYDVPPPPPSPSPSASPTPLPSGSSGSSSGTKHTAQTATPTPAPPAQPAPLLISAGNQLYRGGEVQETIQWPVTITGGRGPYVVTWEWGDGSATDSLVAPAAGPVQMAHAYANPGSYQVTIRATDASGNQAVLQVVTVINGTATAASAIGNSKPDAGVLIAIWPTLSLCGLLVLCFWLGERHKQAIVDRLRNTGYA